MFYLHSSEICKKMLLAEKVIILINWRESTRIGIRMEELTMIGRMIENGKDHEAKKIIHVCFHVVNFVFLRT